MPADYPAHAHVTGYWFLEHDDRWEPSVDLTEFLAAGPPPVYVGFGSMGFGQGADRRYTAIIDAVRHLGLRAVLASGWSSVARPVGDDILLIDSAPHDWLFPRVSAVVHHGGSGTTAAGLRAARPTLICPVLGDQPFWAHQVHTLGAGPDPLPWRHLTAAKLEERLRPLTSYTSYQNEAQRIGHLLNAEDGAGAAVAVLEALHSEP